MSSAAGSLLLGLVLCSVGIWAGYPRGRVLLQLKEKPGTCPRDVYEPRCELVKIPSECERDGDCKGTRKCCYSGCRSRCLLPLEDKTGSCPYFDSSSCMYSRPDECDSDDQCPGSDRCCCFDCGLQCVPTERVKPGQCPPIQECFAKPPKPRCKKDSDCAGKKKCCELCGKKCVDPVPEHGGSCPDIVELLSCDFLRDTPLCSSDSDCKNYEKCCLYDNKMQCVGV
ncbi:uncharacterized protein LOC142491894 [Ascaphus truei]|uniref:uncharacterized protein LOC142491894 n=1 Tax=Ascaphus truei TaxID=8439 RepID=UPI003F5A8F39